MNKVYAVISYGGEYEDKWDYIECVCATKEIAESKKEEMILKYTKCDISLQEWEDMNNALDVYEETHEIGNYIETLHKLFPEYTKNQLNQASYVYDYGDFIDIRIKEIDYYGN